MAKRKVKSKSRVRRGPTAAQRNILEAGAAVVAALGPDRAGLKEVAARAGVSHGLITHYFGRFESLVAAVLTDASGQIRRRIGEQLTRLTDQSLEAALEVFFEALSQPQDGRLIAWSLLTDRKVEEGFFGGQSLRRVADVIEARLRGQHPTASIRRDEIDRLLALVLVAAVGMSFGRGAVLTALGRTPDDAELLAFRSWLADVVRARVRETMGIGQATA